MSWQGELSACLAGVERLAVLGVGSELCGDDAAGMRVAAALSAQGLPPERLLVCAGSTAPENFTGLIKAFQPQLLLLVDAAFMDAPLGEIRLLPPEQLPQSGLATHMLPLPVTLDYLRRECGCAVAVAGIQAGATEFASRPCAAVAQAAESLAALIAAAVVA